MTTLVLGPARAGAAGGRPVSAGDDAERPLYALPDDGATVLVRMFGTGTSPEELVFDRVAYRTAWVEYVADAATDVTVIADQAVTIEVFDAERSSIVSSGEEEAIFSGSPGSAFMIRVRTTDGSPLLETELTFDVVPRVANVLLFAGDITVTPGVITVSVTNGDPGVTVELSIDGETGTEVDVVLDETGTLVSQDVFIDIPLAAGTYTLRAVHPGKDDATVDFEVLNEPDEAPEELPPDAEDPVEVVQAGPRRFVLQDPAPSGLATFTMEQNPTSMSSPFPDNVFTIETTTAPDGQVITWEGARRAKDWTWSGYLETEAMMDALLSFQALNHRIYVIDHRNRAWVVSFEAFEPEPVKNVDKPWAHQYKAVFLIYDGPLTPVSP